MNYTIFPLLSSNNKQRYLIKRNKYYNPNLHAISDLVLNAINEQLQVTPEQIKSKVRYRHIVDARHIYCYIMRKKFCVTSVGIGKEINRDHATVLHSCNLVAGLLKIDTEFRFKHKQVEGYLTQ